MQRIFVYVVQIFYFQWLCFGGACGIDLREMGKSALKKPRKGYENVAPQP